MDKATREKYRRSHHECSACDETRIVGNMFTTFVCTKCGEESRHPNTAVPAYCRDCCEKHGICQRCGNLID